MPRRSLRGGRPVAILLKGCSPEEAEITLQAQVRLVEKVLMVEFLREVLRNVAKADAFGFEQAVDELDVVNGCGPPRLRLRGLVVGLDDGLVLLLIFDAGSIF